jgi:CHAT domain-containing protein
VDVTGTRATRWGRFLATGLLAVISALVLPPIPERTTRSRLVEPYSPSHAALVAADGARRPTEARLSGGFAFAPWNAELLEGAAPPSTGDLALEALVEQEASLYPATLGTRAVLALRRGRPDPAIALLEEGIANNPRDPRLQSDLAAAYLERAGHTADARDLVAGLSAAARAFALDDRFSEAAFNRALALERLGLWDVAAEGWERVIELEADPEWRDEARERLKKLRSQPSAEERWQRARQEILAAVRDEDRSGLLRLAELHAQESRLWVQDELLGQWAEAVVAGREAQAAATLASAMAIADAHASVAGDRLLSDALVLIKTVYGARRTLLAEGHRLYRQAWLLHESQRYAEANPLFSQALDALEAAGSPYAHWARLYLEIETYHRPNIAQALVELRDHQLEVPADSYPVLAGHVHWMLGLARSRRGPVASGLADWHAARDAFQRAGETENRAAMDELIARAHADLGDYDQAWRHLLDALAARPSLRKPRRIENILFNAVLTARKSGELEAALDFQDEFLRLALRTANPLGVTLAQRERAELFADLGRPEEAIVGLADAWRTSAGIPDPGLKGVTRSELLIARGRARCSFDPAEGLDDLSAAADFVSASQHRHLLLAIRLERARCHRARGDHARAEADLEAGIAEAERQQHLLADPEHRRFYLDQARGLVEEAVRYPVERGEADASLVIAERFRAAGLIEALRAPGPDAGLEAVPDSLPPAAALVELLSLDNELLIWVVTSEGIELIRAPLPRRELAARVERFREAIERGEAPRDPRLERELVGRLMPYLADVAMLILVPDGSLYNLPFGALRHPVTGQYLAERFALLTTPSARVWTALANRARRSRVDRPRSVLAVGGVIFDSALFADIPVLPGSAREAAAVANLYPRAQRLGGGSATPERFLAELGQYEVVHVAAHAIDFPGEPELASLVLAPAPGGAADGLLPARDIQFPRAVQTRLVVLAACRSAGGTISATEGPLSLARPFLEAGIPTVVGTLWALDEHTSLVFSSRFHAAYAGGAAPLEAFHEAQHSLLRDPDPRLRSPRSWAGLVLIGAGAGPPYR